MALRLRVILSVFLVTAVVVIASTIATFWAGNRILKVHLREQHRRNVIAMTGFGMQEDVDRAQTAGFEAHRTNQ